MDNIAGLSKDIKMYKENIESICREMEGEKTEFLVELEEFVKGWYKYLVEYNITKYPGNTKELGKEKLKYLKDDFDALLDEIPSLITKNTVDGYVWVHENLKSENKYKSKVEISELRNNIKKEFSKMIVKFYANIKELLERYKYYYLFMNLGVFYKDIICPTNNSMNPWIPDELEKSINKYIRSLDVLIEKIDLLEEIKEKKEQEEAKLLWGEV